MSAPTPPSSQTSNSTQHISFRTTLFPKASGTWRIFKEPADRFSWPEVPLIHETLPETLTLRARLYNIRDDVHKKGLHCITGVAAETALLVFHKYMGMIEESDVCTLFICE
ncbi:hypothetical protein FRC12_000119 [Ceratobasidium sp. 428]|nr:hypothetical protein FRC12_000119 [Ceratobasidium sp. 428]